MPCSICLLVAAHRLLHWSVAAETLKSGSGSATTCSLGAQAACSKDLPLVCFENLKRSRISHSDKLTSGDDKGPVEAIKLGSFPVSFYVSSTNMRSVSAGTGLGLAVDLDALSGSIVAETFLSLRVDVCKSLISLILVVCQILYHQQESLAKVFESDSFKVVEYTTKI